MDADWRERLGEEGIVLAEAATGRRGAVRDATIREAVKKKGVGYWLQLANENAMEPLMALALRESLGEEAGPIVGSVIEANEKRVRVLLEAARRVVHRLEGEGIPSAVIEGAGALLASGTPAASYCAGDIDLLVDEGRWPAVRDVLAQEHFTPADRRGRPTYREEFRRIGDEGREIWIEIGCKPFDRMWVPFAFPDVYSQWLARRVAVEEPRGLFVLSPEDRLLQVAVHTSLHSWVRAPGLRLHTDVDRLVRTGGIDWNALVTAAIDSGVETRVALSLCIAEGLLDTPIPKEVTEVLSRKRKVHLAREMLRTEGILASKKRKLRGFRAVYLDYLVSEKPLRQWLRAAALPEERWMRDHFDRKSTHASLLTLHARRAVSALNSWRPR